MNSLQHIRNTREIQSESDTQSDSDEDVNQKISRKSSVDQQQITQSSAPQGASQQVGRKKYVHKNAVWSKVLCEQQLTTGLSGVNGVQMKQQNEDLAQPEDNCEYETFEDRDVETYFVPKKMRAINGQQADKKPRSLPPIRRSHRRRETLERASDKSRAAAVTPLPESNKAFESRPQDEEQSGNMALERELGEKIAIALCEPKRDLIDRCVRVVGCDRAMKLFEATRRIEKEGGMLIQDGTRRRTAGGVFLQLLRSSGDISRQQKTAIFDPGQNTATVLFDRAIHGHNWQQTRRKRKRPGCIPMEADTPTTTTTTSTADSADSSPESSVSEATLVQERPTHSATAECDERELEEGEIE